MSGPRGKPLRRPARTTFLKILVALVALAVVAGFAYGPLIHDPVPEIPANIHVTLARYLENHGRTPEDYILGKFDDHDVVFLGEFHRVKHDLEFVRDLIPALHRNGVTNLATEFGGAELQAVADSLLAAESYDEDAVRKLMFDYKVYWGYVEYLDIYRAAWALNRSLGPGEQPFRIVHLNYEPGYTHLQGAMTQDLWNKVWHRGEPDHHMAKVLLDEVVARGEKALVHCGRNHSFTKYHQPVWDEDLKKVVWMMKTRLGNLVYDEIGDRACTVLLHAPWSAAEGGGAIYPVGGAIDRVMLDLGNPPSGFDTAGTPFGDLADAETEYGRGHPGFTLATICDGYVFLKPMTEFEGVTVDPEVITPENFDEAIGRFPTMIGRKILRNEWLFEKALEWDADMKHHARNLTG